MGCPNATQGLTGPRAATAVLKHPQPQELVFGPVATMGVWVQTKPCSSSPAFEESSTRPPFSAVPSCIPSPSEPDIPGEPSGVQALLLGLREIHTGPVSGAGSA